MKEILQTLFDGQSLNRELAKQCLLDIASEKYNCVQTASFITAFNMRGITTGELAGFKDAMLEMAVPLDLEGRETIDIVGTGGDGKDTFNISTLSAVVVAGAGYQVCKHGSYGVSSSAGSSDVLQALGYKFSNHRSHLLKQLEEANICFLHAPLFHPAMKAVVPIRKQLGMRSFFNMLGPLVNPAQPKYQLFGTYNLELSRLYQYIIQEDERNATIIYSLDGYDEVSLTGAVKIRQQLGETKLYPEDFMLPYYRPEDLYGGQGSKDAAKIFLDVLHNRSTSAQRDVVLANAGLAIHTIKPRETLEDCVEEARESLLSGKALSLLQKIIS